MVKKSWGKSRVEGRSPQLEMIPYFFFKLIFFAKSQSLWPLLFSKQLLIHGIVNNSVCERLGEDWRHKIVIKISVLELQNPELLNFYLRISIFSRSIACLGVNYRKQTWALNNGYETEFLGGSKKEGITPSWRSVPSTRDDHLLFFSNWFFLVEVKIFGSSIFFETPAHPRDS